MEYTKILQEIEQMRKENKKQEKLFACLIAVVGIAIVLIAICLIVRIL